jgi:ATP-binding cassette, subfamily C (CFTR/MRP), member 2
MNKTILNILKNETVILITHSMQYLHQADYIYVMKEGEFIMEGAFEDVK